MLHPRTIAHFDLDSFFVSVEILLDPSLKGKPVMVGGGDRGVVSSCSYEARAMGVHSAMPSAKAKQLCPEGIFVKSHFAEYSHYSRMVTSIIAAAAPLYEKASVDEFYVDLTGMDKFFKPLQWTIALREKIMQETGLPISFGLASNKMMAKIATNKAKPNGYLQIPHGSEQKFLAPLSIKEIPGVGAYASEVLNSRGYHTIGNIFLAGKEKMLAVFGNWGGVLWAKSKGEHDALVTPFHESKSVSSERTFSENLHDTELLRKELVRLTEKISFELRTDGKKAACVTVKIRYPNFETKTAQTTIAATDADDEFIPIVVKLFDKLYNKKDPIRLVGVRLSDFKTDAIQGSIFNDAEKKKKLYTAIDSVKNKFGKESVKRASSN